LDDEKAVEVGLYCIYLQDLLRTRLPCYWFLLNYTAKHPGRTSTRAISDILLGDHIYKHTHTRCSSSYVLLLPYHSSTLSHHSQTKIADLVQIQASDLEKGHAQVIEDNINAKYANKVIQKIGLCICMYDLLSASDGLIGNGDGLVNVNGVYYVLYIM
jgi:hypothetical protein